MRWKPTGRSVTIFLPHRHPLVSQTRDWQNFRKTHLAGSEISHRRNRENQNVKNDASWICRCLWKRMSRQLLNFHNVTGNCSQMQIAVIDRLLGKRDCRLQIPLQQRLVAELLSFCFPGSNLVSEIWMNLNKLYCKPVKINCFLCGEYESNARQAKCIGIYRCNCWLSDTFMSHNNLHCL